MTTGPKNTYSEALIPATVLERREDASYLFFKVAPHLPFDHLPGQYTSLTLEHEGAEITRHYSIASAPKPDGTLEFCALIGNNGNGTFTDLLVAGRQLKIAGARGQFLLSRHPGPKVFVAGGSGIAPIRAMIQDISTRYDKSSAAQETGPLHLLYGCRSATMIPYRAEFVALCGTPMDLKTWFVTEDRGTDPDVLEGRVTDYLSQAMLKRAEYYICGSQPMRRAVESLLAAQGVGSEAIVTDRF